MPSFSFVIEVLTLLASLLTASIATAAFIYTKKEYRLHVEKEQAQTLSEFNERYCSDKNIETVVKYLIDESNGVEVVKPTCYQKELFMRFFEELEYTISQKALDEKIVYDMFSYYALKAYASQERFIEEDEEKYWIRFVEFVGRMKKIEAAQNSNKQ